jgi:aerobic carbon-monoxide dehydrogenase medium subunit
MVQMVFNYAAPESLDEAVELLKEHVGSQILAGGHSLLNAVELRLMAPSMLVDLRKIQTLRGIEHRGDGGLRIGAMTTFAEIASDRAIQKDYTALAEAAYSMSDVQMRNWSTIGGNLVQGDPGADLPAAVLAFGATLNIFSLVGTRTVLADEFIAGRSTLSTGEIITSIDIPALSEGCSSAYEKFKSRTNGFAICGVAVKVVQAADGTLRNCCLAVTGVTRHAMRLPGFEVALRGQQLAVEIVAASDCIGAEERFISDSTASAEYRIYLIKVLTERAFARIAIGTANLVT